MSGPEQQPPKTAAQAGVAPPHPLALPPTLNSSPDSVNALTDLARTVERVRAGLDVIGQQSQQQQQQQPQHQQWLSSKDVPAATDELKHKIERARAQVRLLPDIKRTVEQQEAEMRALQEKIAKQQETLELLRNSTAGFGGREDV